MNIKRISVPTDFSDHSLKALESACHLARKVSAEVDLIHFIEAPVGQFMSSGTYESTFEDKVYVMKSIEKASEKLKVVKDDVKYVGVRINTIVKVVHDDKELIKEIAFKEADLIIMSTEGDSSLFKFSDTNAIGVAFGAKCPVISLKEGRVLERIRNVVFPTDFKDINVEFIDFLKWLQDIYDFKLHIINVNSLIGGKHDKAETEKLYTTFAKKHNIKGAQFYFIPDLTEYTGIFNFAEEINADLITLHTHAGKGFFHWGGGVSGDLIRYSSIPVLTAKV